MSEIVVTKDTEGKLCGAGEKHNKAYARFKKLIEELEPGEILTMSYWFPRFAKLHGWHFVVLTAVFENQEQFEDAKAFRKWIEVGAGYCDFLPGPSGRMVAVPKSIGWDELDDVDFADHHEKAIDFMRSHVCTGFLWPHLSGPEQANMIEGILTDCEVKREEIRISRQTGKRA